MKGRWSYQFCWFLSIIVLIIFFIILFISSLCPSVWGLNDVDILNLTSQRDQRDCQKFEVNLLSRSEMITWGKPNPLAIMLEKKRAAVSEEVAVVKVGMRKTSLVSFSTTTSIWLWLRGPEGGNGPMKSME